jgi:hypothetical protein
MLIVLTIAAADWRRRRPRRSADVPVPLPRAIARPANPVPWAHLHRVISRLKYPSESPPSTRTTGSHLSRSASEEGEDYLAAFVGHRLRDPVAVLGGDGLPLNSLHCQRALP